MSDKETKATTEKAAKKETTKKAATAKKETAKKVAPAKKETAKKTETKKETKPAKETKGKKAVAPKKETSKKEPTKKETAKKVKDVKEEKKTKKEAENKDANDKKSEESEAKAKGPKKTKAEINKEIKTNIAKDNANSSRKDRTRAEKAAMRLAKEDRKAAYTEEQKKAKLSNLVIAIMIFGVLLLMFAIPWGYNYFKKDASIEAYISNRGGATAFQGIQIDKNKVAALSADGNKMYVTITDSSKNATKEIKYFKGEKGQEEMQFISAYFLSIIRPDVRGITASAVCTANVGEKQVAELTVKYSQIEDILAKRGVKPEDLYKQQKQQEQEAEQQTEQSAETTEPTE